MKEITANAIRMVDETDSTSKAKPKGKGKATNHMPSQQGGGSPISTIKSTSKSFCQIFSSSSPHQSATDILQIAVSSIAATIRKVQFPIAQITMGVTKKGTDPSRAERKAKKRKLEDAIPDLPGDNENEVVEGEVEEKAERKSKKLKTKDVSAEDKVEKKEKKEKKEKTPKKSDVAEGTSEEKISKKEKKEKGVKEEDVQVKATDDVLADLLAPAQGGEDTAPKKSKKERKAERKAKEAAEKEKAAPAPISTEATAGTAQEGEKKASHEPRKNNNRNRDKRRQEKAAAKDGTEKADRFIVFAGMSSPSFGF